MTNKHATHFVQISITLKACNFHMKIMMLLCGNRIFHIYSMHTFTRILAIGTCTVSINLMCRHRSRVESWQASCFGTALAASLPLPCCHQTCFLCRNCFIDLGHQRQTARLQVLETECQQVVIDCCHQQRFNLCFKGVPDVPCVLQQHCSKVVLDLIAELCGQFL